MAETPIQTEHLPLLAKLEHVGEFLQGEQQRLQIEAAHVANQLARLNGELHNLLQRGYGLDSQHVPVEVDTARGVIVTPDAAPVAEQPAPTPLRVVPPAEAEPATNEPS